MTTDYLNAYLSAEDGDVVHYGVKGMKWGVRNDRGNEGRRATTKQIDKLDKRFEASVAKANLPGAQKRVPLEFRNGLVTRLNDRVRSMNESDKWRNEDINRLSPEKQEEYRTESKQLMTRALEDTVREIYGSNASGTKKGVYNAEFDRIDLVDTVAVHDDFDGETLPDLSIYLTRDDQGKYVDFEIGLREDADLEHDDLLHFGVKGMKWGVRKDGPSGAPKARGKIRRGLTKANAALDAGVGVIKEGEKQLIFLPKERRKQAAAGTQNRVLNVARKINRDPQFKGKDLKKDPELKKAYQDKVAVEAKRIYAEELNIARNDAWNDGINAVMGKETLTIRGRSADIKHADDDGFETLLTLNLTRDELDHVTDIAVPDQIQHADLVHFGVKGMKWGVRRDSDESSASKPSGPESTADRYNRLLGQAKKQGANSFSDEELRFVTQRGNAIAQVNRLNEKKPGWASDLAKQVITQSAKKRLISVTDDLSKKYIDEPLKSGN